MTVSVKLTYRTRVSIVGLLRFCDRRARKNQAFEGLIGGAGPSLEEKSRLGSGKTGPQPCTVTTGARGSRCRARWVRWHSGVCILLPEVAYPWAADNVSGPLPPLAAWLHQPTISPLICVFKPLSIPIDLPLSTRRLLSSRCSTAAFLRLSAAVATAAPESATPL